MALVSCLLGALIGRDEGFAVFSVTARTVCGKPLRKTAVGCAAARRAAAFGGLPLWVVRSDHPTDNPVEVAA